MFCFIADLQCLLPTPYMTVEPIFRLAAARMIFPMGARMSMAFPRAVSIGCRSFGQLRRRITALEARPFSFPEHALGAHVVLVDLRTGGLLVMQQDGSIPPMLEKSTVFDTGRVRWPVQYRGRCISLVFLGGGVGPTSICQRPVDFHTAGLIGKQHNRVLQEVYHIQYNPRYAM